jgi:integrase
VIESLPSSPTIRRRGDVLENFHLDSRFRGAFRPDPIVRGLLKVLFTRAIDLGLRKNDPTHRIKSRKTGHWRSWTDDEIAAMEARWPIGTRQRLAFALHIYTGQRRSDVVKMTRADVAGGKIRVVPFKTGMKVVVPIHRDLKPILDASPLGRMYLVETVSGRPLSVAGDGNWLRDSHRAADLPDECVTHGLRKAAGRFLAEAGSWTKQIVAVLGLKSIELTELYTRDAEQEQLAEGGMSVWEGRATR